VVRVPALDPAAGVVEAAGSEPPTAVARRRVLVVDDNEDSAQSLAMLLQTEGHETFTAHDGVSAIQSAEEHRPDVVLLDVGLPKLSGHEVCRQIRSRPWGRDVLLIAVTGWGQAEDRRKSSEAGFDGHLVKPIRYEAVARMLRDCLHRSSTDRETA
jgi:CheY-like chemotaxis protein